MMPVFLSAQLQSGTKLSGNITGTDVISSENVDVQAWLNDGKTVILDVFATWCGPCWGFHQAGTLEAIHEQYGPEGTDQVRVLGIEGDASTPLEHLFMQVSGNPPSLGNWTEGVKYSIINDHNFNTLLGIAYFPTVYVIRPDGTIIEAGSNRNNPTFWEKTLLNTNDADLNAFGTIYPSTFCASNDVQESITFTNTGLNPVTSGKINFSVNGDVVETVEITDEVGVFESIEVTTPSQMIDETTEFELSIVEINGQAFTGDATNTITFSSFRNELKDNMIKILFTTDFYAGETSWRLIDEVGTEYLNVQYSGPANGGGADASKVHEYDVEITNADATCLSVLIADGYGDGMTGIAAGAPFPGVEIFNSNGDVVKEKYVSDIVFGTNNAVYTAASLVSNSNDVIVDKFVVSPNPVQDELNVNVELTVSSKATMSIVNIYGQTVAEYNEVLNRLDVSQLTAGNYSLVITTKEGTATQRFVKL